MKIRVNSKHDCVIARQSFPEDVWRPVLQSLIDDRFAWYPLPAGATFEDYAEEDTRTRVETNGGEETTVEEVRLENPTSRIFRIGFATAEELEYLIENGELQPEPADEVVDD
ncbi:MAG: hypothetical protein WC340_18080 [Kiritimatiellia bacterium]